MDLRIADGRRAEGWRRPRLRESRSNGCSIH